MKNIDYPFTVRKLHPTDGGGYLIEFADLPGCVSDGESVEEAIENGADAVNCWINAGIASDREVPQVKGKPAKVIVDSILS